jgi:hypothetical protein
MLVKFHGVWGARHLHVALLQFFLFKRTQPFCVQLRALLDESVALGSNDLPGLEVVRLPHGGTPRRSNHAVAFVEDGHWLLDHHVLRVVWFARLLIFLVSSLIKLNQGKDNLVF